MVGGHGSGEYQTVGGTTKGGGGGAGWPLDALIFTHLICTTIFSLHCGAATQNRALMLTEVVKVDFVMIRCYISYFPNVIIGASTRIIERRWSGVRRAAEIFQTDGSARREVKPAGIPVF